MFQLIEARTEKSEANTLLDRALRAAWRHRERRLVVWRPSSRMLDVVHNGEYWFASVELTKRDAATPRYWNLFGEYAAKGSLQISVEINVPTTTNSRRVAGFFARDPDTGNVFLMHDGGVGGGRPGIGRNNFLSFVSGLPQDVNSSDAKLRAGLIVAGLPNESAEASETAIAVSRFVASVIAFKATVANDDFNSAEEKSAAATYKMYYDEPSGRRKRQRAAEIEYISRHGEIVRAVMDWRAAGPAPNEQTVKNALIDLGISSGGRLVELYEVKPKCDRQALYTAIGQLMVHAPPNQEVKRFLVVPSKGQAPKDVARALEQLGIIVLRFSSSKSGISIS